MKKLLQGIVFTAAAFFVSLTVYAAAPTVEEQAKALYDLGLLKGTSATFSVEALELDRNATRAEICTTIVRMLGKEQKAAYQKNTHPFKDVPAWASDNIGWLYENYLVNGVSGSLFGASDVATVKQFSTMLLRVVGYDDSEGDFTYDGALEFALSKNLIDNVIASHDKLSRSDMITMCYNALKLNMKNSSRTLARKLCDEGAVDEKLAGAFNILSASTISDYFADVEENLGEISVSNENGYINIHLSRDLEHYGVRVFVKAEGSGTITEIPRSGALYFEKGEIVYKNGGAAGYISDLRVYGLDEAKKYSFIVLKTSSEGEYYKTVGKSGVGYN